MGFNSGFKGLMLKFVAHKRTRGVGGGGRFIGLTNFQYNSATVYKSSWKFYLNLGHKPCIHNVLKDPDTTSFILTELYRRFEETRCLQVQLSTKQRSKKVVQ